MIASALMWLAIPVALFIGGIGAVSVLKAVYIDKRELKCACVGGNSNVPLGFISLTEKPDDGRNGSLDDVPLMDRWRITAITHRKTGHPS